MQLGNVAEWLAAIGTVGALGGTVIILWRERRDRLAQDASALSVWWEYREMGFLRVYVHNTGERAIYACSIYVGAGELDAQKTAFEVIPPSAKFHDVIQGDWGWVKDNPRSVELETTFMDSAGVHWRRTKDGQIQRIGVRQTGRHP